MSGTLNFFARTLRADPSAAAGAPQPQVKSSPATFARTYVTRSLCAPYIAVSIRKGARQ